MNELYEELTKFVNENRKAFESMEPWLGQFDGNYDAAWEDAQADLVCDWRKIVFVISKVLEKKDEWFIGNMVHAGGYITSEQPDRGRIRKALEEGKKAVKDGKLKSLLTNTAIEYSFPLPMTKWSDIFGVSENTLRELRKKKKYHFDQVSPRKWRLPKHEMPAEYLEKYRQAAKL